MNEKPSQDDGLIEVNQKRVRIVDIPGLERLLNTTH